jgi:hypothetical protein
MFRKSRNKLPYSDRKLLADEFAKMLLEQREIEFADAIHAAANAWSVNQADRSRLVIHVLD